MSGPRRPGPYNYSEYSVGSVIRVKMINFMTYTDAILEPGPRLNLVLGPNGTGKSSFVCAVCVGLGGSTHLLGRANDVKEYIRRGAKKSTVEVTLSSGDPNRPIVVVREMTWAEDKGGTSEWKLNGASCPKRAVTDKMKEMNVQLDNLCQFLPQDKVTEFARMSPIELLAATQKAIGDSRLADLHAELITEKRSCNVANRDRSLVEQDLQQQEGLNERLQRDVDRFQNREQLLAKAEIIQQKIPWIIYNDALKQFQEAKEKCREAEIALAARKAAYEESQVPIGAKSQEWETAKAQAIAKAKLCKKLDEQVQKLNDTCEKLKDDIDKSKGELDALEQKAAEQQHKVEAAQRDVDQVKDKLANLPSAPANTKPQQDELQRQIKDLQNQNHGIDADSRDRLDDIKRYNQEIQEVRGRLSQLENVKSQRLQVLGNRIRNPQGLKDAYDWINKAKQEKRFRGEVYGPVLLEVQVQDRLHAAYLEGSCPLTLWHRFVTVHEDDQSLILQAAKHWSFRPIVSNYSGNPQAVIQHPKGDARQFDRYGITHTLDEVFQAPAVIKHLMTDEVNLNEAYVGTKATIDKAEACLVENRQLANLWTPESHYTVRTSQYNRDARSQAVQSTLPASMLVDSVDSSQLETLRNSIAAKTQVRDEAGQRVEELKGMLNGNQRRIDGWRKEFEDLKKAAKEAAGQRQRLNVKLSQKEKMLARYQGEPDPRNKAPQLQKVIHTASTKTAKLMADGTKALQQMFVAIKDSTAAETHTREMALQHDAMKRAMSTRETQYRSYQDAVKALKDLMLKRKEQTRKFMNDASEKTGGPPNEQQQQQFNELDNDIDVLREDLQRLLGEAEGITCANPRVLQEYQERQKKILELQSTLANQDQELADQETRIKGLHDQWYPDLKATVEKINKTFQHNFGDIGCAGEVNLQEHEDYDKFAIQIKVKFRDEEDLQVLTANRQSGGERSVSTILYLISIQDVTVCPFRVVDEINQGMDPINERKVFMQLVESACRPGTPQCFLLTPKLLPALPFAPAVQVLQIWNGVHIKEVTGNFREDKVLGKRKRIHGYAG